MSHIVTVTLSEHVYQNYEYKARTTNKSVNQVIEEVICADQPSPPPVNDAPEALRADLRALEKLSNEELRRIAESHLEPAKQRGLSRLLDKNQAGMITKKELQQLDELLQEGQRLMVIKAHAWVLLKWRGEPIPTREELRKRSQREWK
ncbi:hypothetical protein HYR99_20445 [Candidatus Poribacteria bacterium]|nr:hypothetical protein [Candidatus Poribacteria bacterium]